MERRGSNELTTGEKKERKKKQKKNGGAGLCMHGDRICSLSPSFPSLPPIPSHPMPMPMPCVRGSCDGFPGWFFLWHVGFFFSFPFFPFYLCPPPHPPLRSCCRKVSGRGEGGREGGRERDFGNFVRGRGLDFVSRGLASMLASLERWPSLTICRGGMLTNQPTILY